MNAVRHWLLGAGFLFAASSLFGDAGPGEDRAERVLRSHIGFLNEMSERRRVNTLFPNEQSAFYGVPIRYVNSHRGNLTFLRRDLVTVGRIPVVLARVYDSSLIAPGPFGPGWHLTLAETIVPRTDGTLRYRDDSASEVILARGPDGYEPRTPGPSDLASVRSDRDGMRVDLRNGWTKRFTRMNGRFALAEVSDPHGNRLTLTYVQGRLARVEGKNGRFVAIAWDSGGRIVRITDDQRREVNYGYDATGRLEAVTDLGRNRWLHEYDASGRLERIVDPRGSVSLEAAFGAKGRASTVRLMGAAFEYRYEANETFITDSAGRIVHVRHSPSGLATSIKNPIGFISEVELDKQNRISALLQGGVTRAMFFYGVDGRMERLTRIEDSGPIELTYEHDQAGRPTQILGTDGTRLAIAYELSGNMASMHGGSEAVAYGYSPNGELRSVTRNGETTTYAYDADGQVESITTAVGTTRLFYDSVGKLRSIRFADGSVSEYRYNNLGFREAAKHNGRGEVTYHYDVAGNLRLSDGHVAPGKMTGHEHEHNHAIEVNAQNQAQAIRYPEGKTVRVTYDANGNPETVTTGDDPKAPGLRYIYDAVNRVVAVESGDAIIGSHVYKDEEPDLRNQLDDRTMRVGVDAVRQSGSMGQLEAIAYTRPYGKYFDVVRFDQSTFTLQLPSEFGMSPSDAIVSNSITRRRFADIESDVSTKAQDKFDLPSNVIFLPPEYATINCAPGCQFSGLNVRVKGNPISVTVWVGEWVELKATAKTPNSCNHVICEWYVDGVQISQSNPDWYIFPSTGQYWVDASCECSPCDVRDVGTVLVDVQPLPPLACAVVANQDLGAKSSLGVYPLKEPFERGHTMMCDGGGALTFGYYVTSWETTNDPCAVNLTNTVTTVAGAHSHPWFDTAAEYLAGNGCLNDDDPPTFLELQDLNNSDNKQFSVGDINFVTQTNRQLYMRIPSGTQFKVRRYVNGQQTTITLP